MIYIMLRRLGWSHSTLGKHNWWCGPGSGSVYKMDIYLPIMDILSLQTVFSSDTNRIHPSYIYEKPPTPITAPTTEAMTVSQAPSVPSQAEVYPRVRSFTSWPKDTDIGVADLVKPGFYYLGYKERVQCVFSAAVCWKNGKFLKPAKHKKFPVFLSSQNVPTSTPSVNTFPVAPRNIRARLNTETSRRLMELEYKKPLLALVIADRLAQTGDDFCSFIDYFMVVKKAAYMY